MSSGTSSSRHRVLRTLSFLVVSIALMPPAYAQRTKPAPPAPDASQQKKDEAKTRFEKGMTLFDRKLWDAALVEFLESRAAYPTRSNTQNAALCLRNLNRFDEALDMFEALLRDFPNLSSQDKQLVEKEVRELESLVGTIELLVGNECRRATCTPTELQAKEAGAQIFIDGRERGNVPSPPLRVSAGSHVVRVYKQGYIPVE